MSEAQRSSETSLLYGDFHFSLFDIFEAELCYSLEVYSTGLER